MAPSSMLSGENESNQFMQQLQNIPETIRAPRLRNNELQPIRNSRDSLNTDLKPKL